MVLHLACNPDFIRCYTLLDTAACRLTARSTHFKPCPADELRLVSVQELNFSATHLLYRDESASVHLHTIASAESQILLKNCSYCQWAPDLDVIVAQSGGTLHVWYSALCPGSSVTVSIPGTVESITSVKVRATR